MDTLNINSVQAFFEAHFEEVAYPANMKLRRYYPHTRNNKLNKKRTKLVQLSMSSEGLSENSNRNSMNDCLIYTLHTFSF